MPTPVIPSPEACATPTAERLLAIAWIRDHASRLPAHKQLAASHIADEIARLSHHPAGH